MRTIALLTICLITLIALIGCGGGGGGGGVSNLGQGIQVVDLPTRDLEYDPGTQRIYVSVPNTGGSFSNTVAAVNPASGTITGSVFVGSNPTVLAVSDNSQYVYVGVDAAIRRVNLPALTAGLKFSVGYNENYGPLGAVDIEVLPGQPDTVAVARSPYNYLEPLVVIFRNGVLIGSDDPYEAPGMNKIEFSDSASTLYGTNGYEGFSRIAVSDSSGSTIDSSANLLSSYNSDIEYDNGLIYATSGEVIDPNSMTLEGNFPVSGLVEPDSAAGRVYFLTRFEDSTDWTLRAFNSQTFVQTGSLVLSNLEGTPTDLVRCGNDRLAFGTDSKLYIVQISAIH